MNNSTNNFSNEERLRYARQTILPLIGEAGQMQLKKASILLIGAGGLGSAPAIYLAAAGVGTIGLIDADVVSLSNLHRQILHTTNDLDKLKVVSGSEKLQAYNPNINVITYPSRLTVNNALEIFSNYDLIIDGTDNLASRYLINDACFFLNKHFIFGGVHQFEGQVSIFGKNGPCYRCLFSEPPPTESMPSCAQAGVIGVLPGIIGLMQANEAIKWICNVGDSLLGRLLIFDALSTNWREIKIKKDPSCPLCGNNPSIQKLDETTFTCTTANQSTFQEISVQELKQLHNQNKDIYLLDVREKDEWQMARINAAQLKPLSSLEKNFQDIPKDKTIYCFCKLGGRSKKAIEFLKSKGYSNLVNVKGGIDAWAKEIDRSVEQY